MNQSLVKGISFCVIIYLIVGQGAWATVKCYNCNSMIDSTCETISSKTTTRGNCTYCLKIYQELDGLEDKPCVTHRECIKKKSGTVKLECDKYEIRGSLKADTCRCGTSLCNATPTTLDTRRENWVTLLLSLLVAVFGDRFAGCCIC